MTSTPDQRNAISGEPIIELKVPLGLDRYRQHIDEAEMQARKQKRAAERQRKARARERHLLDGLYILMVVTVIIGMVACR